MSIGDIESIPTERVDFNSHGTRCAAWLTLPGGAGPHPAVVLAHGLGATHDMMLAQYEQHFAAAGIACGIAWSRPERVISNPPARLEHCFRNLRRELINLT